LPFLWNNSLYINGIVKDELRDVKAFIDMPDEFTCVKIRDLAVTAERRSRTGTAAGLPGQTQTLKDAIDDAFKKNKKTRMPQKTRGFFISGKLF